MRDAASSSSRRGFLSYAKRNAMIEALGTYARPSKTSLCAGPAAWFHGRGQAVMGPDVGSVPKSGKTHQEVTGGLMARISVVRCLTQLGDLRCATLHVRYAVTSARHVIPVRCCCKVQAPQNEHHVTTRFCVPTPPFSPVSRD